MAEEQWVVALDVGGTHVSAGLASNAGEIMAARKIASKADESEGPLRRRLIGLVGELIEAALEEMIEPVGIAVGSPGIVDFEKGVLVAASNLPELFGVPLGPELNEAYGLPVVVENDVNARAAGEMIFGVARGVKNFVIFSIGTDLGGGLVIGGKLHRGAHNIAAEFGHLTLDLDGPQCMCGGHGCASEYVSGAGVARKAWESHDLSSTILELAGNDPKTINAGHVFEAARREDQRAKALVAEFIRRFGAVIADVMKVIDPELVVLAGSIIRAQPRLINNLVREARHYYFPLPRLPDFRVSELTKDTAILGPAAVFFIERNIPVTPGR